MTKLLLLCLAVMGFVVAAQATHAQEAQVRTSAGKPFQGFPFLIPFDGLVEGTAPADLVRLGRPAGAQGFVRVDGDRFVLSDSGEQVRFWATNVGFGACFLPHETAERVARRLATLGVNCVRFHHMDMAGYPNGIWSQEGSWGDFPHTDFHPDALDRLDYFIAQLKTNGVYADLNLHVSRTYGGADGFATAGPGERIPDFTKAVDEFYPPMIEGLKGYARALLTHVNPYTGNSYANEPAVAMIEISNEDGLLAEWKWGSLDRLPAPYRDELRRQWNRWLLDRYGSADGLRAAWAEGSKAGGGPNILDAQGVSPYLETHGTAEAQAQEVSGPQVLRINVTKGSDQGWHVQQTWGRFAVTGGEAYVLTMRLRANRETDLGIMCGKATEPWDGLGLDRTVHVGTKWQDVELTCRAPRDEAPDGDQGGARIVVNNLAQAGLQVWMTRPVLRRASVVGLPQAQRPEDGTVPIPVESETPARTERVYVDYVLFLRDTESAFWRLMRDYIRDELGARQPITGTAGGFTSPLIAAETADFVDSHAYWQHPNFPGEPWDMGNWTEQNIPMVNDPAGGTLGGIAGRRVLGLPFTVTEYNHPAPNEYCAEGFPLIAAYGSAQGWDGVFQFSYNGSQNMDVDHFDGFFDMVGHPVQLAVMPACSAILRRGGIRPALDQVVGALTLDQEVGAMRGGGPWASIAYTAGVPSDAWQRAVLYLAREPASLPAREGAGELSWEVKDGRGSVRFSGADCAGLVGFVRGATISGPGLELTPGQTALDGFAVVLLNSVDGQPLGSPGRHLITALGTCANPGMVWNAERNSLGRNWGTGPTQCEGVPLRLTLRPEGRTMALYSLNPDGTRREEIAPVASGPDAVVYEVGPARRTLWYELVIKSL